MSIVLGGLRGPYGSLDVHPDISFTGVGTTGVVTVSCKNVEK